MLAEVEGDPRAAPSHMSPLFVPRKSPRCSRSPRHLVCQSLCPKLAAALAPAFAVAFGPAFVATFGLAFAAALAMVLTPAFDPSLPPSFAPYICVRIDCRVPALYSDRSALIHRSMGAVAKLPLSCCLLRQTNGRFEVKGAGFRPRAITQQKLSTLSLTLLSHGVLYIFPAYFVRVSTVPT